MECSYGCQLVSKPINPEPIIRTASPSGPWQDVAIDLLGFLSSRNYIFFVIDHFIRYLELVVIKTVTTEKVIKSLTKMFTTHGSPIPITSNNGPQFVQRLSVSIKHRNVISLWPQVNGEVKRQNRSLLKRIKIAQVEGNNWKKEMNAYLLMYRFTPHSTTSFSPAELLFKRKLRTKLSEFEVSYFDGSQSVRDRNSENIKRKAVCGSETRCLIQ